MRLIAKAFVFSISIMLMLSRTTYSQQNKYQNPIKSATYLSEKFELRPGEVLAKALYDIEFPIGHIGVKSFDVDLVDEQGNSVPLYETYIHHWFALRYHVSKDKNMSHDPNDPFGGRIFKRNYGTCNGGILPHYWGMGSESRGTSSKIPDPFAVELGNPEHIPKGWEEKWLFSLMFIDTRGTKDRKSCTECRKLALRYKITWVDWDQHQIHVRFYVLDSTDHVKTNGSETIHDCLAEYTIPENNSSDSFHVQKASIPMEKCGYLIYSIAHMHTGVVNATLYGQDGRTLCTSTPRYGTGKEAGNEEGYVVGMSVCYPKLGSIRINDGETVTVESRYKNEFLTGAMGHMYLYLADRLPDTINTSNSYNL
ncbi:hypothetical protein QL285_049814 [Trifolium repens]|nr:hypothetical protein QL285_049814 [Trifolium repens]